MAMRAMSVASTATADSATALGGPFPLRLPPLGPHAANELLTEAHEAWEQLFVAIRIAQNNSYGTRLGGLNGQTVNAVMMCTTTKVFGTLEEVAALYTGGDCPFILDFVQSKRLYQLEVPSPAFPMRCTGLRWSKWKATTKLISDRDLLYLESMDTFVDRRTGRRGWARSTKSIEHSVCPPDETGTVVRAEILLSGMIVRETESAGELEMTTLIHADIKNIPAWIARAGLKSTKRNALRLNHVLKIRRCLRQQQSQKPEPAMSALLSNDPSDDPRVCKGCHDRVSRWSRPYKCRKCHSTICKRCAKMSYFDTDTLKTKNRFCADCSFDAGEDGQSQVDGSEPRSPILSHDHAGRRGRTFSSRSADSVDGPEPDEERGSTMFKLSQLRTTGRRTERKVHRGGFQPATPAGRRSTPMLSTQPPVPTSGGARRPSTVKRTQSQPQIPPPAPTLMDLSYLQSFAAPAKTAVA